MPGFRHSVGVLPLPFPPAVAPSPPFRSNRIESYFLSFCRRRTTNQRSGHFVPIYMEIRFQHFRSHAQRKRYNGTAKRQRQNGNGMVETRHYSVLAHSLPGACHVDVAASHGIFIELIIPACITITVRK